MLSSTYENKLFTPCDRDEITKLSHEVFKEGHLELIDDLIFSILPLAHIVYYKYIKYLDDREYAKEDLISEAILLLYQDMTLRWDKFIHIESYYMYYSIVLRNCMINLVHDYHNYYSSNELDPEFNNEEFIIENPYTRVEVEMMKESIESHIIETSKRILKCRQVNTKLLLNIFNAKYVEHSDLDKLKSRVRVLGISYSLFEFYCEHVDYVYRLSYNLQYAIIGGKDKMVERISNTINRFEDVTYRMLSANYYDSIIPEMYAELGAEMTKRFVKIFSDRTIKVPRYRDFCDDLLGGVVLSLSNGDKDTLYRVAEEYGIPYRGLLRIYNKAIKYDV